MKLHHLIERLKAIADDQMSSLEKAIISRGEWAFLEAYEEQIVSESHWFSMTHGAKEKHLKKILSHKPANTDRQSTSCSTSFLGVKPSDCRIKGIAEATVQGIFKKAENLVNEGHVTKCPWSSNNKDTLVKSSTTTQPHSVKKDPKAKFGYVCDNSCAMFKGFSFCSHVVATAHINSDLTQMLDNIKSPIIPNLTAIANHGMSRGSGRKGGVAKRKRSRNTIPIASRSVRSFLSTPSEIDVCTASSPFSVTVSTGSSLTSGMLPIIGQSSITSAPALTTPTINHQVQHCAANVMSPATKQPFFLKFKTAHIKVCQSCRKNYDGPNDTLGLVVARAEKRLISNLATGSVFFGRESNSHYHLHVRCLCVVDPTFTGRDIFIQEDVKSNLNVYQKAYLVSCFGISV